MMQANEPDQTLRLQVASHIKVMTDDTKTFEAWRADEIVTLLNPMPTEDSVISVGLSYQGASSHGVAEGLGNVTLPDEEKSKKWSIGEKEFRCGAYVISKQSERSFKVRFVMDVDAAFEDGKRLKLEHKHERWEMSLNTSKTISFGSISFQIGTGYKLWKIGV